MRETFIFEMATGAVVERAGPPEVGPITRSEWRSQGLKYSRNANNPSRSMPIKTARDLVLADLDATGDETDITVLSPSFCSVFKTSDCVVRRVIFRDAPMASFSS